MTTFLRRRGAAPRLHPPLTLLGEESTLGFLKPSSLETGDFTLPFSFSKTWNSKLARR